MPECPSVVVETVLEVLLLLFDVVIGTVSESLVDVLEVEIVGSEDVFVLCRVLVAEDTPLDRLDVMGTLSELLLVPVVGSFEVSGFRDDFTLDRRLDNSEDSFDEAPGLDAVDAILENSEPNDDLMLDKTLEASLVMVGLA